MEALYLFLAINIIIILGLPVWAFIEVRRRKWYKLSEAVTFPASHPHIRVYEGTAIENFPHH